MFNTVRLAEYCIADCHYGIYCNKLFEGKYFRLSCILCDDMHYIAFCMVLDDVPFK